MKIVEVIPISKAISKESLSYFTAKKVKPGSIIRVPLRKKEIKALVINSGEVSSSKAELRSLNFVVKKVIESKPKDFLLEEFITSAKLYSDQILSSTGSVLHSLIPSKFLDEEKLFNKKIGRNDGDVHEKYVLQTREEERFANYKSIIRSTIAKKKSVIFLNPTTKIAEYSYNQIRKGIDNYSFLLHSSLKKKEYKERLSNILKSHKPVVVVTTSKFLSLPIENIGSIIIEKEASPFYKSKTRPFIDIRSFAEIFAKELNARIYYGDIYLQTETLKRYKDGELIEQTSISNRATFSSKQEIVDMKDKAHNLKGFKVISPELERLLKKSISQNEKMFLFAVRKGLYPLTLCGDCGKHVLCERCSSPVTLHTLKGKNYFLCHKCGRSRSAEERCQKCLSWKLVPLGIGIDLVLKKLEENFKNLKIFKIDGESAPTPEKREKIVDEFNSTKGGILLGTEVALSYLDEVPYSGIVSLDSLFSIPDFRINERILHIVLQIKERTKKEFILQTRHADQKVLSFLKTGNLLEFYRHEIEQRENFNFPPFKHFVKISFLGKKEEVLKEAKRLKEFFVGYNINIYPGFVNEVKNKNVLNALIIIDKDNWPDLNLKEKILSLPQKFSVDVNPDNLL